MPPLARIIIALYAVCLSGATVVHLLDLWHGGWLPYHSAPKTINLYWSLLSVFDPLAVVLLYWRPRFGLLLTLVIIISDVCINSVMQYGAGMDRAVPVALFQNLQAQTAFLGFVLGSAPFLLGHLRK
ncbi:hypothetical protein [Deinococcus hopiensis]|uniref:Uncharacterized protein n=1 Tax=Deinococcus hopiensis KR-140 TaxID=695939 RepID=A0A1W1UZV8_9DEIO|nr:hypothetical protein [Deinococcus hopiensis]SMB86550.1 hypothetical protein SAMN00790413_03844 [Deinococcus hopiensis KR-140]